MKLNERVKVLESEYPDLFPVGSIGIVWDIYRVKDAIKPIGIILESDESEDPRVGWFESKQLEVIND